jgi:hypothetical protein
MMDIFNSERVVKAIKENISCVVNDDLLFLPLLSL